MKRLKILLPIVCLVIFLDLKPSLAEKFTLQTPDGYTLIGEFSAPEGEKLPTIILLHMLNRDRNDWATLIKKLNSNGFACVAIDQRGHGESINKGDKVVDWHKFTTKDFNRMVDDVKLIVDHLKTRKEADISRISLIGASIGANIALQYASGDQSIKTIILLSPGLDYRGVKADRSAVSKYGKRPILLVASEDDSYSAQTCKALITTAEKTASIYSVYLYKTANHGTWMLEHEEGLYDVILNWLNKYAK